MGTEVPLAGLLHDPYKQEMDEILFNMKKKLKVYYAHFMGIYNTIQEERDITTLESLGLKVFNPNCPLVGVKVRKYMRKDMSEDQYKNAFEKIFFPEIDKREVFAFKALPDGRIPGGVAMELRHAQKEGKIIIELPSGTFSRSMTAEDTQEYLRDIGER